MSKQTRIIEAKRNITGTVQLPGSKSITHRALLMAALASGKSVITNPLWAEDTLLTADALRKLGVELDWDRQKETIVVQPPGERWRQPREPLFLGNSGTSMRLLLGLAATGAGTFVFDGNPRLRERPIGPVLDALQKVGINYRCLQEPGYPPVEITSRGLEGGEVIIDASQSSQFLSSLLIASPLAKREMRIGWHEPVASFPYVQITLAMMEQVGVEHHWLGSRSIVIPAPQEYPPMQIQVEADCSSASYFWAAAAVSGGGIHTRPLSPASFQGDCRLLDVLAEMGCTVEWKEEGVSIRGPETLRPVDLDMNQMPDMVPTVAVLAACAEGRSFIRNVAHLRVKESDRLHVTALELGKFGVPVKELPDGLVIDGGKLHQPRIPVESHDDHRIAMAFAVLGLCVGGVEIRGAEAVAKSFPRFWEVFDQITQ